MRHKDCRTWDMARKLKNVENVTQALFVLEYGKKHSKTWKMTNAHCRTCSMSRILRKKNGKSDTLTVAPGIWRKN
jgi:hypothetical protein